MKVKLVDLPKFEGGPAINVPGGKADKAQVETILPKSKQMVVVWCAGCGKFHGFLDEFFTGDADHPSTTQPIKEEGCVFTLRDGLMAWDASSTHRLAGKELPLPHEETWNLIDPSKAGTKPPQEAAKP